MTAFWIVAAALLVLVSLALVLPLLRTDSQQGISRSALNTQLYRQRLKEMEEEREQGVVAEESDSLVELQRSLLDDIPDVEQRAQRGKSAAWIPGVVVLVVVSLGLYYQLGSWQMVSRWQDASSRLGELSNLILVEPNAKVTEQDLLDFTLALRTRLKEQPNDYRGWLLLGRMAMDGNDPQMAREALELAYQQAPTKSLVAVPYAQALMMTGDDAQATSLLQDVITANPNNLEAHSVFAFMALQKEDFQGALSRWQAMLPLMKKGSPRYVTVERSIAYARAQLKLRTTSQTMASPANGVADQGQGAIAVEVKGTEPGRSSHDITLGDIPLRVTLGTGITMPADPHLFVFAVVPNGPPVPIAVKHIAAPTLPLTLSLGDSDAMVEGSSLGAYPELQFKARLSHGNNVMNKQGAFEGISIPVKTAKIPTTAIDIQIDRAL
ncbi:MAG: c-type cytochrome biogenesis protein CcmI [Aeromonas sp.]